jgi:phosphatidylglycerophosphatase A
MRWREFFFTAAYAGYAPVGSGTVASLLAMGLYALEYLFFGRYTWAANAVFVVLFFYPSVRFCDAGEKHFGRKDPHEVVLDEVMGYFIAVLFHPFSWKLAICAFVLFRIMDIVKPYPVSRLEKISGGLGIILDDCMAGVYTNILLLAVTLIARTFGYAVFQ